MTFRLPALVMLCAACGAVRAATSPLAAEDYVWFKPGQTNLITGYVAGDAECRGVMRFEDVAFLNEAFAERNALGNESYSSNSFATVAKSTNRNWNVTITVSRIVEGLSKYLREDCELSTSPRILKTTSSDFTTNSFSFETWNISTNTFRLATTNVTQMMRDGSLNVFTNMLPTVSAVSSNVLETVTVTNSSGMSYADFCTGNAVTRMSESRLWKILNSSSSQGSVKGPYSKSVISNHYVLARAMRRTVPRVAAYRITATNATRTSSGTSRPCISAVYDVDASHSWSYSDVQHKEGSSWVSDEGYPATEESSYTSSTIPYSFPLSIDTGLSSYMVGYRSQGRVGSADVFALVWMTSQQRLSSSHSTEHGEVVDVSTNVYKSGAVMIPVGNALPDTSSTNLMMTISAPSAIYQTACSLLDIDYLSSSYSPSLPQAGEPEYQEISDTERSKSSSKFATHTVHGYFDIYIVLNLTPNTKLQTWSEYE